MPFDSTREAELDVPFSKESLAKWLRQQDPDGRFDFSNPTRCLWANYTTAKGGMISWGGCEALYCLNGKTMEVNLKNWRRDVVNSADTYGQALGQLLKLVD